MAGLKPWNMPRPAKVSQGHAVSIAIFRVRVPLRRWFGSQG
jgi:hypothetical protein